MMLVDANLLLYAYDRESPQHGPAREWLEVELSSGRPVRFALVTLLAFVRIASDRRVFANPLGAEEACEIVGSWLALPAVRMVSPGPRSWPMLGGLCDAGQVSGAQVMDAHLAALAVEHGLTIATTDRDFLRFPGVEVTNPLAPRR